MEQAASVPQTELDSAEEAAATEREDASLAHFLQTNLSDNPDPEQAALLAAQMPELAAQQTTQVPGLAAQQPTQVPEQAAQDAARVPPQPGRYDPAGGSLWDDQ